MFTSIKDFFNRLSNFNRVLIICGFGFIVLSTMLVNKYKTGSAALAAEDKITKDKTTEINPMQHRQVIKNRCGNATAGLITLDGKQYAVLLGHRGVAICPVPTEPLNK